MEKSITHFLKKHRENVVYQPAPEPKKSTIEFIRQFARVYSYQKALPLDLGSFNAN